MGKNIVVCSDGTGNADIRGRGTNVFKLFEAVEFRANQHSGCSPMQIAIYHDGLGTEDFKPLKMLGAMFGYGFSRHVRQLYTELARCYVPGDKIFLFGFSRGAFIVRALAGLIAHVGLVDVRSTKIHSDKELQDVVALAYSAHRKCYRRFGRWRKTPVNDEPALKFRQDYAVEKETPIEFVGVWDTVDAVGFPLDEIADFWHTVVYPFRFPDTDLSSIVKCARHAMAIDDERRTFHAELWNETPETKESRRIVQVWFAGAHSNVGGGYPKQGLSLIPLVWMMQEAEAHDLHFVHSARRLFVELQNVHDKLYDSRAGLAGYYAYKPRNIQKICAKYRADVRIHASAFERISLATSGYAPGNLTVPDEIVSDQPGVDAKSLHDVVEDVFATGADHLNAARKWIWTWRICQGLFVALTLLVAILHARDYGLSALFDLKSVAGYRHIGRTLFITAPLVTAAMVLTYTGCYWADHMLRAHYSEFWFRHRNRMRRIFMHEREADAAA